MALKDREKGAEPTAKRKESARDKDNGESARNSGERDKREVDTKPEGVRKPKVPREVMRTQADSPMAKRSEPPKQRVRREHGPSPADRYNGWALGGTLAGWLLLLLGQRVLPTEEGLSTVCTLLGLLGLVAGLAQRVWAASLAATDRLRAVRAFAVLSAVGLLALLVYYTTTDSGRELLGVAKARVGEPDRFGDVATVLWITLLMLSVLPSILGELARRTMLRAEQVESRRILAAVVGGVTLALAAAYGSLFTFTAGKLDVMADFSFFRVSRPSESTQRMIESLEKPVAVRVWFPQNSEVKDKVLGYLRELQARSALLEVEERDRFLDPELAKEDKVRKDGVLTLVFGKKSETVDIGVDEGTAANKLRKLDGDFQESLHKVLRDKRTVYMTVGHGELYEEKDSQSPRQNRILRDWIERQNYEHKKLGLGEGLGDKIPDDASVVMVLGPTSPFSESEIEALREFAERGGSLLLALDPDDKADMAPLAAAVGVKWEPHLVVSEQILFRMKRNDSDKRILIGKRFSSHPAISTLSKASAQGAAVLIPGSAALDRVDGLDKAYNIDFAVKSEPSLFVDLDGNWKFDDGTEKKNTFNLVAAVTKKIDDTLEMRAVVLGDAEVFTDPVMDYARTNQLLFAEALRWLGREESFTGQIESEEDVRIVHTKGEDQVWFYTTILGMPSAVLALGLTLTLRGHRRKKKEAPKKVAVKKAAVKKAAVKEEAVKEETGDSDRDSDHDRDHDHDRDRDSDHDSDHDSDSDSDSDHDNDDESDDDESDDDESDDESEDPKGGGR